MTCTTFVTDSDFRDKVGIPCIDEWLQDAQKVLGKRIGITSAKFRTRRFFGREIFLYSALIDIGHGQAQIINFAPRDGSSWSINTLVPAQEVAAWLMGIVTGGSKP